MKTGRRYTGSTNVSTLHRAKRHRTSLVAADHPVTQLQADVELYGLEAFEVLEFFNVARPFISVERARIDHWQRLGLSYNDQRSEAWRKRQSDKARQQHADGNFGRQTWKSRK